MTTTRSVANRDNNALLAELGLTPSLGNILSALDLTDLARHQAVAMANLRNLLVTSTPGLGGRQVAIPHPMLPDVPLLAAVQSVDTTAGAVAPFDVTYANAAGATDEGEQLPESVLTYSPGELTILPTIGHTIPLTRQALAHNPTLQADVDAYLSGGLLVKLEQAIADALAASTGTVAHPFDTDIATTLRTGVAAAANAMRELGPGLVTVALSPLDHAALDMSGVRLSQWPAVVVSSPALPAGVAYIGRLKLAAQLFANPVAVVLGYANDQFTRGKITARATVDALAHIAAPGAIVRADLTA